MKKVILKQHIDTRYDSNNLYSTGFYLNDELYTNNERLTEREAIAKIASKKDPQNWLLVKYNFNNDNEVRAMLKDRIDAYNSDHLENGYESDQQEKCQIEIFKEYVRNTNDIDYLKRIILEPINELNYGSEEIGEEYVNEVTEMLGLRLDFRLYEEQGLSVADREMINSGMSKGEF